MCRWMASLASRWVARTITQRQDVADSGQSAMATTGQILLTAHSRHSFETSAVPRREHGGLCHPTCHLLSETRCVQHDSVRTRSLVSRASWGPPASVRTRLRPLKVATRVRIPLGVPQKNKQVRGPGITAGTFVVLHRAIHWLLRPARFQHRSADSPGTRVVVCEQAGDVASDGPFRLVVAGVERFDVNDVIGDLLDVC
jgi:hypothetical protein